MSLDTSWENSCRLCGEQPPEMLQIFGDEGKVRRIAHKLRLCLPVMVYRTDPLPKMICQFCAARLDDVFEFREYCIGVYRKMHEKMMENKDQDSVKIFLDAMGNSPDPCQAQLCLLRSRAPPPLVPLPSATPLEATPIDTTPTALELPELPCEVEINEDTPNDEILLDDDRHSEDGIEVIYDGVDSPKVETKKTSILEQVLTGSLTINDCKELNPRPKLSSTWWCSLCNNYYKNKSTLMKHMKLNCPKKHFCAKCSEVFTSVEELARHEGENHLKITLDFEEDVKKCQNCDREFVSYEMLKNHRIRDHLAESLEAGSDTWCSICNRFFASVEAYKNHKLLHENLEVEEHPLELTEELENSKREHFIKSIRSLACPTCGKVCTQQSALSNHMRTHEPKKYKCDDCGRSFGLLIRLETHRLSEHNQKTPMLTAVEQEEALNAEREAREAREAKIRGRPYDVIEAEDAEDQPPAKKANLNSKNVARCGICEQWFNDHTTMLNHLQTHSESLTAKNFTCQVCKKSFKEKWQLQRHEVSHKKNNKNSAPEDDNNPEKLKTVEKTFHCQKCNKIFFKEFSLVTHQCMREKKYKCPKCLMFFGTSQARASHMRLHPSIKGLPLPPPEDYPPDPVPPPKLDEDTSPGTSNPLLLEPRVEINEEPPAPLKRTLIRTANGYRCGVCQSPFVLRELAVAHLRSAHPVMPYQCPYCKKRFTTQYTFTHHIKTDHPNESEK